MDPNTLHTERLVMLQLGPADLDETAALYGDPEVMRDVVGGMKSRAATAAMLEEAVRSWRNRGWGLWAIRDATTGAFLGEGGLQDLPPLDDHPEIDGGVEFGYTFCRRSWGHGYATEAGEAIMRDAWERFEGEEIHTIISMENVSSQKVLRKLGFEKVDNLTLDDEPHQLWVANRPR